MDTLNSVKGNNATSIARQMLNKVPEVTMYFWIIKVLCTTVGESAADLLNVNFNLGLINTTIFMGILLVIALIFQLRSKKYIPGIYWLTVVLISIFGTLITDNLSDNLGISLVTTTIVFSIILAVVFAVWYWQEKSLSIHSIITTKREFFYWLAILFTFALGTAAGDLIAEKFDLGYLTALFIFAGAIALVTIAHYVLKTILGAQHRHLSRNAVLAFWLAYILTRPLGASIGDYLASAKSEGGVGLGTVITSVTFLVAILVTVIYLAMTKKDVTSSEEIAAEYN